MEIAPVNVEQRDAAALLTAARQSLVHLQQTLAWAGADNQPEVAQANNQAVVAQAI